MYEGKLTISEEALDALTYNRNVLFAVVNQRACEILPGDLFVKLELHLPTDTMWYK